MTDSIAIRGSLIRSPGPSCGCAACQATSIGLGSSGACCDAGLAYDKSAEFSWSVATAGAIGQAYADIPGLGQFTAIEFLYLVASAPVRLRLNPTRPQLVATAAIPGGGVVAGAATIIVTDATGVQYTATVTFTAGTSTPALVVGAINGALAAAGAPFPPDGQIARLGTGGLLAIVNPGIGPATFVDLAVGAPSGLGLGTAHVVDEGTAQDMPPVEGLVVLQFPRSPNAPAKIQVSGVASLDIIAAGRVA